MGKPSYKLTTPLRRPPCCPPYLRPSKYPKFYTTAISVEKNLRQKSVNFIKIKIATNCLDLLTIL